jgi:hypothetical protein
MAMTGNEIKKQVQSIFRMRLPEHQRVELLQGFIEQQQREAFATGKAQAYREMFSVIRELAGKEKTAQAVEELPTQPGRAGG